MSSPSPNFDFAFPATTLPRTLNHLSPEHRRTLSSISPSRDSSLQKVWAEDYLDAEASPGDIEGIPNSITPPPVATLTTRSSSRSISNSEDEEPCPPRYGKSHQRSLTALLPFYAPRTRTNSISPQRSPVKGNSNQEDYMAALTGDTVRITDKAKGSLSAWFTGSSAPVAMGIPVGEQEDSSATTMHSRDKSAESMYKIQSRPTISTPDSNTSTSPPQSTTATTSRFNFFSPKPPVQKTIQLPQSYLEKDEYLTLDINSALFPDSSPGAQDPFSPAAFKNLCMNAEGLLLKLQTAYKLRSQSLHELSETHSATIEELDEADTRAQSLRSQLEDMATKVTTQDHTIADLMTQLSLEKQARAEEKEARERSIQIVQENRLEIESLKRRSYCSHEDLGISEGETRKWRHSGSSELTESDMESDSVFSRSRSPTLFSSANSTMTTDSTPEVLQASLGRVVANPNPNLRPKPIERPSTFQKLMKGISSPSEPEREPDIVDEMFAAGIGMGGSGCENCRGRDASVAWDTVGLLRSENKALKGRVVNLEGAVEGALDLCGGLGV